MDFARRDSCSFICFHSVLTSPGREALHLCFTDEATIRTGQSELMATLGLDPGLFHPARLLLQNTVFFVCMPLYMFPAVAS